MPSDDQKIINLVKSRRNTKNFKDQEVPRRLIEILLDSAVWAPNHRNTEPWKFFVVGKDSEVRKKIAEGMISLQEETTGKISSDEQKLKIIRQFEAGTTLIFVFSIMDDDLEITEENYAAVCCAIQNMQLVAESLGLGVGWSTGRISKIKSLNELFRVHDDLKMVGVLTVGYPGSRSPKARKDFNLSTEWL